MVDPPKTKEQERYFTEIGSKVSFNIDEMSKDCGHWFHEDKAPSAIANWCYDQLKTGIKVNDYTYEKDSRDFLTQGAWRKFDQLEFAKTLGMNSIPELRQWGFYYVPKECQAVSSKC